jgi:hypothetical protein
MNMSMIGANLANLGITNRAMLAVFNMAVSGLPVSVAATAYTLQPSDAGKFLDFSATGAVTVTVPPDTPTSSFPLNGVTTLEAGAGGVTIAAGSGVTIVGNTAALTAEQVRHLRKTGPNAYTAY